MSLFAFFEEAPCILEFGAGLVTESGTESGSQLRIESENADGGLQLDCEQLQQGRCHEPLADTRERLSKQDERIRELELALQQQQTSVPIP